MFSSSSWCCLRFKERTDADRTGAVQVVSELRVQAIYQTEASPRDAMNRWRAYRVTAAHLLGVIVIGFATASFAEAEPLAMALEPWRTSRTLTPNR